MIDDEEQKEDLGHHHCYCSPHARRCQNHLTDGLWLKVQRDLPLFLLHDSQQHQSAFVELEPTHSLCLRWSLDWVFWQIELWSKHSQQR
jgi:hypothetical protein